MGPFRDHDNSRLANGEAPGLLLVITGFSFNPTGSNKDRPAFLVFNEDDVNAGSPNFPPLRKAGDRELLIFINLEYG